MAEKTLTYSDNVKGWVSFYSFFPDWMCGMNNYFYTWNGGNLYRHNTNPVRNQFYGVNYPSYLKTVLNEFPLDNKIFKTISLVGDDPWDVLSMETDLQVGRNIDVDWFEEKESTFFAFVRNANEAPALDSNYPLRSLTGIGRSASVTGSGTSRTVNFATTIQIGSIASVGDYLYYAVAPYTTPVLCGVITAINVNLVTPINRIVVDISSGAAPVGSTDYFLTIKNQVAESNGILGHYCVLELENNNTEKIELFTVNSETMKSFP